MTTTNADATPDALMGIFKGKSLVQILIFTCVVHVVLIIGSSVPYLIGKMLNSRQLSEEQRIENAVKDATVALQKIADKHGLNPQDVSSQFTGGRSRTAKATGTTPADAGSGDGDAGAGTTGTPVPEKSAYQTNLETAAEGPAVPTFDEGDDIF